MIFGCSILKQQGEIGYGVSERQDRNPKRDEIDDGSHRFGCCYYLQRETGYGACPRDELEEARITIMVVEIP